MYLKIRQDEPQFKNIWITSDTHAFHKAITRGTSEWKENVRDFDNEIEMTNKLVNNINEVVERNDLLISLGDWSFNGIDNIKKFRDLINCKNIILIYGNHDHHLSKEPNKNDSNGNIVRDNFISTDWYLELIYKKKHIYCSHFPILSWDNFKIGSIHLHGHNHFNKEMKLGFNNLIKGKMMDVGVDGNNLYPYHIDEILEVMKNIKNEGFEFDHHK